MTEFLEKIGKIREILESVKAPEQFDYEGLSNYGDCFYTGWEVAEFELAQKLLEILDS